MLYYRVLFCCEDSFIGCFYAECHYSEVIMLNVFLLTVILASVILLIVTMLSVSLQNVILFSIITQSHFAVCAVPAGTRQNDGSEKCHSNDCLGARTDPLWEKMKQSDVPLSLFHLT